VKIHVSLLLHQEGLSLWGLIHSPSLQGCVCVVNAASNRDIEVFAAGMIQVHMTTVELIDLLLHTLRAQCRDMLLIDDVLQNPKT
jgi:hypothetical protein